MKILTLYFILHIGIGGLCGFLDIKMKTYQHDGDMIEYVSMQGELKSIEVSKNLPYWVEEIR
jgi:hypothetical protein